jgi:catechol 2,3-dioxygenase-like lactoylglutathione lyase family enzyme
MITGIDHVQVAMPPGSEDTARGFYAGLLGMTEDPKPAALATRGGCWFHSGAAVVHLGVEEPFAPAKKAHLAFLVADLDAFEATLADAGHACLRADDEVPGVPRFYSHDPFGNRVEFQQARRP